MAKLSERNPASAPGDWYIDHLPTDEMRARLDALVQRM